MNRSIVRGRPVAYVLVLTLISALLLGCGSGPSQKQVSESSTAATNYSGELVLSSISPPKSFNPITAKETSTTQITNLMFEGLTRTNGVTGEVEPNLAKDWELKEEGRVWLFTLREDLKWSDGSPLTADDVVFTYNKLYLNPKVETSARFILFMEGKPPEVSKINERVVRFEYPEPYAPFARVAALEIMPRHIFKGMAPSNFNSSWGVSTPSEELVVSGPFTLDRYLTDQRVILKRNPNYFRSEIAGETRPKIARINFEIIQNTELVVQRFLKGDLDAIGVQPRHYPIVKPRESTEPFTIHRSGPDLGSLFLTFNMNTSINKKTGKHYIPEHKLAWFNDVNFRRAVSYGLDRGTIENIVYNSLAQPRYGPVSPANKLFYNPNLEPYPYDTEKAKKILEENGYRDRDGDGIREDKNGNPIRFVLNTNSGNDQRVEMSEIIRQDLANLGFNVTFNQVEFNTLVSQLNSSFDWEAVVIGFTGGLEPHFGSNLWKSSADLHLWHPRQKQPQRSWEAEIDRIFQEAVKETDQQRRKQLYWRWQEIVNNKQPVIYTVTGEVIYAVRDYVHGAEPTAIGGLLHNVEELNVVPH